MFTIAIIGSVSEAPLTVFVGAVKLIVAVLATISGEVHVDVRNCVGRGIGHLVGHGKQSGYAFVVGIVHHLGGLACSRVNLEQAATHVFRVYALICSRPIECAVVAERKRVDAIVVNAYRMQPRLAHLDIGACFLVNLHEPASGAPDAVKLSFGVERQRMHVAIHIGYVGSLAERCAVGAETVPVFCFSIEERAVNLARGRIAGKRRGEVDHVGLLVACACPRSG